MPTYDYDCLACQTTVEIKHAMSNSPSVPCEVCGRELRRRTHGLPFMSDDSDKDIGNKKPLPPRANIVPSKERMRSASAASSVQNTFGDEALSASAAHFPDENEEGVVSASETTARVGRSGPHSPIMWEGRTSMPEEGAKFSDEVDRDKLLVEVVQGLLMAHARLDQMENTLRQAVETASLQHLNSFDKR